MPSCSDTISSCSYKELLDSEDGTCVEEADIKAAPQRMAHRRLWSSYAFALGCIIGTLICSTVVAASWATSHDLRAIHKLVEESHDALLKQKEAAEPLWASHSTSEVIKAATIDGVQVPGYQLKHDASYCGELDDPAGAPARGCVLDRVQGGWVPEVCSDPELREAWDAMPDFGWYLDAARTQRIPQERVYRGDPDIIGRSIYTGVNYHLHHCIAVLRLRNKNSLRRDRGLTFHMLSHHHIEHCYDRFLDWLTPEGVNITKMPTEIQFSSAGVVKNKDERTSECYVPA